MTIPLVELSGIKLRYDNFLLNVPSFVVGSGEIVVIIGPNGAGKSTLLRVLGALEKQQSGVIKFRGAAIKDRRHLLQYRREIAMVFQENLLFRTSVWNNLAAGLRFRKLPEDEIAGSVHRWAREFGIEPLLERPAWKLSGGEAKKVCLARALVLAPRLLLLDEPFNDLDQASRENFQIELRRLLQTQRISAVWVTHDHADALRLADRLVVMSEGRILQSGPPEMLHQCHANSRVAQFIGAHALPNEASLPPQNGRVKSFVERKA